METCKYPFVEKALKELFLEIYNEKALKKDNKEFFSSDEGDRTVMLLQILLNNYNKSARIFGTSLCNKIMGDEKCRKILETSKYPVKIILTNSPSDMSNKIKDYFYNNFFNQVEIKETKLKFHSIQNPDTEVEFLVLDDMSYLDEVGNSISKLKFARGNFNNLKRASYLAGKFDEVYNKPD